MFKHPAIWIEPLNRVGSPWVSTEDCVWDGPQWLRSKQCLKLEIYRELEHLFKVSLKVPNSSRVDIVTDLLMLKRQTGDSNASKSKSTTYTQTNTGIACAPSQMTSAENALSTRNWEFKAFAGLGAEEIIGEAEKRYSYLWQMQGSFLMLESEPLIDLRSTFERCALVYIPKECAWCPPSQCVWVESSVKIPGKYSIADAYTLDKTFFTIDLEISEPTVEMYIDSLKAQAKEKASAAQIKETMALICGLGVGKSDLSSLIDAKVFPVKLANGVSSFASASFKEEFVDFVIVENNIHRDAFKGKIVVLDFSLEEIRDTRPLLLAIGLAERFSSKLVKEVTDVKGGTQDHEMTRNLRMKSQAIVRYVVRHRA